MKTVRPDRIYKVPEADSAPDLKYSALNADDHGWESLITFLGPLGGAFQSLWLHLLGVPDAAVYVLLGAYWLLGLVLYTVCVPEFTD